MRWFWRKREFVEPENIKISLHPGYHDSGDAVDFFSDASGEVEIDGSGYSFGGSTIASKSSSYEFGFDQAVIDIKDPSWTTSTVMFTYAVVARPLGALKVSIVEENWLPMARLNGLFSVRGLSYLRLAVRDAFLSGVYDAMRTTYMDLISIDQNPNKSSY